MPTMVLPSCSMESQSPGVMDRRAWRSQRRGLPSKSSSQGEKSHAGHPDCPSYYPNLPPTPGLRFQAGEGLFGFRIIQSSMCQYSTRSAHDGTDRPVVCRCSASSDRRLDHTWQIGFKSCLGNRESPLMGRSRRAAVPRHDVRLAQCTCKTNSSLGSARSGAHRFRNQLKRCSAKRLR